MYAKGRRATFPSSAWDALLAAPLELGTLQLKAKLHASEALVSALPTKDKTFNPFGK